MKLNGKFDRLQYNDKAERQLAEIQAAVASLISADKNHRNKAPIIKELAELSEKYRILVYVQCDYDCLGGIRFIFIAD